MCRIAQIGTFDCENYGDLLFPLIFQKEMSKRISGVEIDLFSPVGGIMPFHDKQVISISRLASSACSNNYCAYIIGGGDLIRFDEQFATKSEYNNQGKPLSLWSEPFSVARSLGAEVIFNAPGVPFPIDADNRAVVRDLIKDVSYISVRGANSANYLKQCGIDMPIHVVPDTGFCMRNLYSQKEIDEAFQLLVEQQNIPHEYILVQYNDYEGTRDIGAFIQVLKCLEAQYACKVLLMPAGYVHKDQEFLNRINVNNDFQLVTDKLSPLEMMAIISKAKCAVASSFHVVITSLVFNVPVYPLHIANTNKMSELCEMIGAKEALCNQFSDLLRNKPIILPDNSVSLLVKKAEKHMDEIAMEVLSSSRWMERLQQAKKQICEFDIEVANGRKKIQQMQRQIDGVATLHEQIRSQNELINDIFNTKTWRARNKVLQMITSMSTLVKRTGRRNTPVTEETRGKTVELSTNENLYEENIDFSEMTSDIKPIALYLPQFHTIPENDEWWGTGFTEWTNAKKGVSRFDTHNQPRVPDELLGYYDLTDVETIKKQVSLAKQHGIYAFAMYYYWFSGKRLLEKPMDLLLQHPEIDIHFFAVWANENWTRTWDGMQNDVLIAQNYDESDYEHFILDLKKYIDDPRYMRVDGKPVIAIYAPRAIPDFEFAVSIWRETARKCGIGDIQIWTCISDGEAEQLNIAHLIDGQYEFPPRNKGHVPSVSVPDNGVCFSYDELIESERRMESSAYKVPTYRGSMLEWDNSARKKENYHCWGGFTPKKFYLWNCLNVAYTRKHFEKDKRFIFINAWNEWGEGTYLEPDRKYGYAAINALSKAIMNLPFEKESEDEGWICTNDGNRVLYLGGCNYSNELTMSNRMNRDVKVAIHVHAFYPDTFVQEVAPLLSEVPIGYDLYVSTDKDYKAIYINDYLRHHCVASCYQVKVLPNKGRDVLPLLTQMKPVIDNYDYFCHIHTKKSLQNDIGDIWREYLYENLLGSKDIILQIINRFENKPDVGLIMAENPDFINGFIDWGSNKDIAQELMNKMGFGILPDKIEFPAGNMFWGRVDAVKELFEYQFDDDEFPNEMGQLDGTIMHAIERLWVSVAKEKGYKYQLTRSLFDNRPLGT